MLIAIAAPISDYRQDAGHTMLAVLRSLPLVLVVLFAASKCAAFARLRQWKSAAACLSIPVAGFMLYCAGQAVGDYFEVHWAAHSMSPEIDANYRHVAARAIYSDATGYVRYVVFDPADGEGPAVERTVAETQGVCVSDLRPIGDHFYLVRAIGKPF